MPDVEALGGKAAAGIALSSEQSAATPDAHGCLNCGAALQGSHCHRCGQKADVHRTFGAFWHDLAHGVLHFEGKIWRTLPMLAFHPGGLTRRYVDGERTKFLSPIATFLFSTFLMFAIFSAIGSYAYRDQRGGGGAPAVVEESAIARANSIAAFERQHAAEREENLREIKALELARSRIAAARGDTSAVEADIAAIRREMAIDQAILQRQLALQRNEDERAERHRRSIAGVQIHPATGLSLGWLDEAYGRAKQNPKLLGYKLQSNAYKFSWVLIPISVPLVWLLFLARKYRRFTVYDHTVFVTYSIAFMSLFAIAYTLLKVGGMIGPAALIPFLIPPVHMYRHVRGTYQLTRWSALWRTAILVTEASIALALFALLLLVLGVLG